MFKYLVKCVSCGNTHTEANWLSGCPFCGCPAGHKVYSHPVGAIWAEIRSVPWRIKRFFKPNLF